MVVLAFLALLFAGACPDQAFAQNSARDHALRSKLRTPALTPARPAVGILRFPATRIFICATSSYGVLARRWRCAAGMDFGDGRGGALPAAERRRPGQSTNGRYGFLLGTVKPDGQIDFAFHKLNESDVPASVVARYKPAFVHWCFAENSSAH
jgi:hypothetical protein